MFNRAFLLTLLVAAVLFVIVYECGLHGFTS
jgi:hypothetical protein